jgi:ABC-type polysaccharide/polyol phosphate export permease
VVSVLTDALDYLAALPLLLIFLLIGDGIPLTALALPVLLAVQFMLTTGLGFALCSANVYVRDVRLFVDVATLLGWYLTPIFYSPRSVPEAFRFVLEINPMAHLISAYRSILLDGQLPDLGSFTILGVGCIAIFVGGYLIYRASSPTFVDEL